MRRATHAARALVYEELRVDLHELGYHLAQRDLVGGAQGRGTEIREIGEMGEIGGIGGMRGMRGIGEIGEIGEALL